MRAPVSVCIICDDDPHLEKAVASVEPWVAEVVVHRPGQVPMEDFSRARNESFAKATQPWVMWLDSDDVLQGADQLVELCKAPPGTCYMFPYEYAYGPGGKVTVRQYRERLFNPRGAMQWRFPIHEVMVPVGPALRMVQSDAVTITHQRQFHPKPQEPGRNLRILRRWMAEHPDDVRNQFYLGLELDNAGEDSAAVEWLERYVKNTGWDDEKAQALFRLVGIHERRRQYQRALDWAFEALKVCDWFESHFAVARQFYHLKKWERCVHYARLAENAPPTRTVLFVDESARHELHTYLNIALNMLDRTQEALDSALAGLKGNPEHPWLLNNRRQYEKALGVKGHVMSSNRYMGVDPPLSNQHGGGCRLAATTYAPVAAKPIDPKCLDIVFVTASWERWDPESIKATGIGGSETMLANMAKHLAKLGHRVRVYADPTKEGTYDGAEWLAK
jgi:tetratricopeptide (TPR) repeat protein